MKAPLTLVSLGAVLALAACSTPEGYPDLQVREVERVSGSFEPPAGAGYVPTPTAPATIEQLGELVESARTAHRQFLAATGSARTRVEAARGAAVGSENWSVAQVAVANLEGLRSTAMIALADIDRIYVDAAVSGGEVARLEAAKSEVDALVAEENRVISTMLETIGS